MKYFRVMFVAAVAAVVNLTATAAALAQSAAEPGGRSGKTVRRYGNQHRLGGGSAIP